MLRYLNYDNLNIDEELNKIKRSNYAEIVLEPNSKKCLFILGMLFANGVKIKLLNEKDLELVDTNKSFSMMSYVWSKIGDNKFPLADHSDIRTEMDRRIENVKRNGTKVEKIIDKPIKNKIFLICPVRNATKEQRLWIENFVDEKQNDGYIIHAPHLHTNQIDPLGGYSICKQNAEAVASSSEIDIYYDQSSAGSVFDLGVAYSLHKPLILLNQDEIKFNDNDLIDHVISTWPYNKKEIDMDTLKQLLIDSYSVSTCSPGLRDNWSKDNPTLGQCAITALIVNDFFGGKIMRCMASSGSHYYNSINGARYDLTVEQFLGEIPQYEKGEERTREYLLSNEDTKNRYELLLYNLKQSIRLYNGKKFRLIGPDGKEYISNTPGNLGGNRKLKIYGKLDCPSAKYWLDKGYYEKNRVFFKDEETAIQAGYRPCAICMPKEYQEWKKNQRVLKLTRK